MSSTKMTAEAEKTRLKIRNTIAARSNTGSAGGASLFVALRKIFQPHEASFVVVRDEPGDYSVQTRDKTFFGGVRTSRTHTSVYLAKLFADPALLESVSPALKKRIAGASFAFRAVEPPLFEELAALVARCLR
ncbi:MAG: hypothetical protein ACXWUG_04430 [Polyangiales bacterium]